MITIIVIDGRGGWRPADEQWTEQTGLSTEGAVLVRPDNIIAHTFADDNLPNSPTAFADLDRIVRRTLKQW
jgi:hypothetical protein